MTRPSHFQDFWLVCVYRMTMYLSICLFIYTYIQIYKRLPSLLTLPLTRYPRPPPPPRKRLLHSREYERPTVLCCAEFAPPPISLPAPSFASKPRRPSVRALDVASDMAGHVRTTKRLDVIMLGILGIVKFGGKYYVNMYTRTHAKQAHKADGG